MPRARGCNVSGHKEPNQSSWTLTLCLWLQDIWLLSDSVNNVTRHGTWRLVLEDTAAYCVFMLMTHLLPLSTCVTWMKVCPLFIATASQSGLRYVRSYWHKRFNRRYSQVAAIGSSVGTCRTPRGVVYLFKVWDTFKVAEVQRSLWDDR